MPNWQTWYPSVFDAARDLGLIRARVCTLSSLLLSNRHAGVMSAAKQAHREQWGGLEEPLNGKQKRYAKRKARRRAKKRR